MKVKRRPKKLLIILIFLALLLILSGVSLFVFSSAVDKSNKDNIDVVVSSGMSSAKIGSLLKDNGIIRSETLFKLYLKLYNVKSLKAATYQFNKSMSLKEVVNMLEKGSTYNPNMIRLTFKEGKRVTDYAKVISDNTNHNYNEIIEIINDTDYLNDLIGKYWFLTDKILDNNIYYALEGYLMPDTYHFDNKDVEVRVIVEAMLDETEKKLDKYRNVLEKDIHYYITMASMAELEGTNSDNRKKIVGVFENRLKKGMNLGSDVTTYYGLQVQMTSDLTGEQFSSSNSYNTRAANMAGKMPVGPICNPGLESIMASISPDNSDYLYFVADKHGNIYFTKTYGDHEKKVKEIKDNGDWIW